MWQNIVARMLNPEFIAKVISSLIILAVTTVIATVLNILIKRWRKRVIDLFRMKGMDKASALETQVTIIRRLFIAGIYFFALIIILLQFDAARSIGAGLLASAGVAGIIIGMAAQTTFSNIVAGVMIAFSQPVKLNDAVIFEGDFGWIEEISLMHTIIKTWDNRRIVVPNGVLANRVIQNWTMKDASLLGIVMLYVDYYCDVDKVRNWVSEIVKKSQYWSGDSEPCIQVVDFTEKTMILRILAKANDAPSAWDLRCELREKLIKKFKEAKLPLPRIRIEGEKIPQA
jgi:small-conductance mechanosensitive channel